MRKVQEINVIMIGNGAIGKALLKKVSEIPNWSLAAVISRSEVLFCERAPHQGANLQGFKYYEPDTLAEAVSLEDIDLAFIAIPSTGGGKIAMEYISVLLKNKVKVVTCEKGAIANFYPNLARFGLQNIGVSATVGGGTRMLSFLKDRQLAKQSFKPLEVHCVLNGTLNYIFSEMEKGGRSLPETVAEAKRLQITEPGAEEPMGIISSELSDVVMKSCALFNLALSADGKYLTPEAFEVPRINERDLKTLSKHPHRYVVSFENNGNGDAGGLIGGLLAKVNEWTISSGFYPMYQCPISGNQLPESMNNIAVVREGEMGEDGIYPLSGPGAGPKVTASAMITDALHLLG